MTDEELDNARAIEALNAYPDAPLKVQSMMDALRLAARLAREGWAPNPVHEAMKKAGYSVTSKSYNDGSVEWKWHTGVRDGGVGYSTAEGAWRMAEETFEREIVRARELMTAGLL